MKITKKIIKEAVKEALEENDIIGTMDAADYYGPQDDMDNVLNLLDVLQTRAVRANKRKLAGAIRKAGDAIESGNLKVADRILVYIFKTGGKNRAVYHAISYVRDMMEKP